MARGIGRAGPQRREAPPPARYNAPVDTKDSSETTSESSSETSGESSGESSSETSGESSNWLCSESARLARLALFGFILTFIVARTAVFLIMARLMPNLYFFLNGTHVHHLNYGIFLLAGVGAFLLFSTRGTRELRVAALAYGIAMALTFDEFGMWLHLGGSYWQRASVDAIIVVAAVLGLIAFASAMRRFESRHVKASIALLIALIVFGMVLYDASVRIGRLAGPRLEALELASSP
jgi:hypothetical protein